MPNSAPDKLVDEVKAAIRFVSPVELAELQDTDKLESKCRLFSMQRKALAAPFQRTARKFKKDDTPTVTRTQCDDLKTVKAAIKLVAGAAGFSYEG